MRVDAISANLQAAKVMPLKNAQISKVSNSETLKSDVFQKQNDVRFGDVEGAAIGGTVGAIAGLLLCGVGGPLGLLAYYGGMALGGLAGHAAQENS